MSAADWPTSAALDIVAVRDADGLAARDGRTFIRSLYQVEVEQVGRMAQCYNSDHFIVEVESMPGPNLACHAKTYFHHAAGELVDVGGCRVVYSDDALARARRVAEQWAVTS